MICAFSGPSCSGKTTLTNAIAKRLEKQLSVGVINEVARTVFREKFREYRSLEQLRKDSDAFLDYEIAILERQCSEEDRALRKYELVLTDRSVYDTYIYSRLYLPEEHFNRFLGVFRNYCRREYSIIFLCHPVSAEDDGFRTESDLETQQQQMAILKNVLSIFYSGRVVEVRAAKLRSRVDFVLTFIKDLHLLPGEVKKWLM